MVYKYVYFVKGYIQVGLPKITVNRDFMIGKEST